MAKLPNAPLQEVIFEVRWDLDINEDTGQAYDSGFELAAGKLWNQAQSDFPDHKRMFPPDFPVQILNYQPVYQFFNKKDGWPIFQFGPGIFTINDTEKNYDWPATFLPLIKKGTGWLNLAYDSSIRYSHASLRYIDSIISDKHGFKGDWLEFIQDNLNITVKNQYNTRGKVLNVQLNQAFELNNNSRLQISVSNGQSDKKENLLVWEIGIHRTGSFTNESLMTWLLESHEITSDVFKDIVNDTLYERFR